MERRNIHRDVKPENLLLCSPHDDIAVKVTDFGIAVRSNQVGRWGDIDEVNLRRCCGHLLLDGVHRDVKEVLWACHSLAAMHRDVKPENLLLCSPTDDVAVKVTDSGIAAPIKSGGSMG
ncbi:unnamed protein product [Closterium sp. NIES-53]